MRMDWMFAATAAAVCGVIAAPAGMASAESAQDMIGRLQSEGYTVNIDRIGTAPLSQCVVTSVRNPQTVTQLQPLIAPGNRGDRTILVPVVTSQTVSVSLNCSG